MRRARSANSTDTISHNTGLVASLLSFITAEFYQRAFTAYLFLSMKDQRSLALPNGATRGYIQIVELAGKETIDHYDIDFSKFNKLHFFIFTFQSSVNG
ncbi:hypothetical protein LSTR_LSTR007924 [Laodelphax striatellus]|uniref:Uncharacterized protein n=1 Tax=Laodelphax striatellus TaxID=195883 RepID=A0A482XMB7_LAOST|nr:hypothetical protein LSTR_LSTR007924 [Laodelphax striatellus]